jgi:hypothetical protein
MRRFTHVIATLVVVALATTHAAAQDYPPPADPPRGDDRSYASLHAYIERLQAATGDYRTIPLDWKAEFYEWELWRYHLNEMEQIYSQVELAEQTGVMPKTIPLRDMSTWNGSVMAALSFKYAVTREPETLRRLAQLVRGMHFFFQVTGVPGLMARAIHPTRWPNEADYGRMDEYTAPDGRKWYVIGDPAKGGYNQIAGGYAALMMYAAQDLPPEVKKLAHDDMTAMIVHLVRNNWKAQGKTGPTTYGDLTPVVAGCGVPFNAQVAYELAALGHHFLPSDPPQAAAIENEFRRLRDKHHCYFEYPLHSLVLPQKVGGSPFVKGMNDRNHVTNAAFIGLMLDIERSRRTQTPYDGTFVHQLGQTMVNSMEELYDKRNSLCTFMWAGLTRDAQVFAYIVPKESDRREHVVKTARAVVDGVEQLRRFKLDRWWTRGGAIVETKELQWNDAFRPDDSIWKVSPLLKYDRSGATATHEYFCAMDYLYAYWVMRYFHLEDHQSLKQYHGPVLAPTPGLRTWNAN